ncbi:rod shape-determining protein MreD [Nonomuraea lactucae]|uniref:rod shape-determining protein MreD n=1 Tax=Nonomuraea lactucae TaxID=2249762 RepID=UPI000DE3B669|nr:rod shape-determining protein MreD [Nonomuraea lactucae]
MTGVLIVLATVLVQVIMVNRVALPGGATPDLVVLAVIGVAMARGPAAGAVIGFCAGLLVDVMPPTAHLLGHYAFVLAIVGYLAGRGLGTPVTTVMLCVVIAPLLAAGLGGLISDPRVTVGTLTDQVPLTIAYTLILSPIVMWLYNRGTRPGYAT